MSDTISRQAAIRALNEQIEQCNKALGSFDISANDEYAVKVERASLIAYREQLENLPSAQPRLRGQWLPDNRNSYEERFVCSVCKRSYEVDTCMGEPTWHFCPGCGADMREEEQDD